MTYAQWLPVCILILTTVGISASVAVKGPRETGREMAVLRRCIHSNSLNIARGTVIFALVATYIDNL